MLRRTVAFVLSVSLLCSTSGIALADEDPPPKKSEEVWYGWQTLLVDVTAVALLSVRTPGAERDSVPWVGLGTYVMGPPLVHLAHGSPGKAGASAAIRVLGPIGGAALGFGGGMLLGGGDGMGAIVLGALGFVVGGTLGYAGAVATDAAVLAREGR